jgi:glycosyltransferase involved in cell wall biosynthesis
VLAIPALRQYLKKIQPDILLSALTHVNVAAMIASVRLGLPTKIILTERNFFSTTNAKADAVSRIVMPCLLKCLYNKADKIVGISKGVIDDISRVSSISADKAAWIHNPVVTPEMEAMVFPAKVAKDVPVIITSGRLVEQKDHATLLKTFAKLFKNKPAKLIILGEGPLDAELKLLAKTLGIAEHVDFKGYVESPWVDMAQADLFVISSRWEGFCNVIVEAMLAGLPIVSTDCSSGPAEILEDGHYGTLVPVGDDGRLLEAMLRALDTPVDSARQRQRAMAFTVQKICDQYETMFKNVLETKKQT